MHRFWIFPLVLGVVGAAFPAFSVSQGWMAFSISEGQFTPAEAWQMWVAMSGSFQSPPLLFFGIGAAIGLVAALVEMARFGLKDRSGARASRRLAGNLWWLGIYALLLNASFALAVLALSKAMLSVSAVSTDVLVLIFLVSPLGINALAILWATIRTALVDDVLSPRVLRGKWRQSNRAIE